jgi:Tol biopolymer transport system component
VKKVWRPTYTPAMRALIAVGVLAAVFLASAGQAPAPNPASPAPFDIYLVPMANGLSSLKTATPQPLATAPGYDNQPAFTDDGARVLFAANRDGKQTDIYVFTRADRRIAQLTATPTNENSPTPLSGGGFSVVMSEMDKTQRLWKFDAAGKNPQLMLADIKPVGYHAWIDASHLVLFILGAQGKPATLQVADVNTGKAEIILDNVGRSLHRIPGTRLASFVQRDADGAYSIKQIDITTKKIDVLTKTVEGSTDRDMAWMPDGKTILMTAGAKVFSWTRGDKSWSEVFDGGPHRLGAMSRLSVSPKGDAIAIVVAEPSTRK